VLQDQVKNQQIAIEKSQLESGKAEKMIAQLRDRIDHCDNKLSFFDGLEQRIRDLGEQAAEAVASALQLALE
jgi:hypothetical protein